MRTFQWWRDKDNRDGLKAIFDILKIAVPALVILGGAVWGYFYTADKGPAPDAPDVTVTTGDGSGVVIGDGNTQTITND